MITDRNCIPMFATANDTNQWVVAVDGRFGLFPSLEEAESVYAMIDGEGDLGDTPFVSCRLIAPGHRPMMDAGIAETLCEPQDMTRRLISESVPIDIVGYIKAGYRKRDRCLGQAQDRLSQRIAGEFVSHARKYILPLKDFWSVA